MTNLPVDVNRNPTRKDTTRVLVIVSRTTGAIRRIIDADLELEYQHHINNVHLGEMALYLTHTEFANIRTAKMLKTYVARLAGFYNAPSASSQRHVLLCPEGHVVRAVVADTTCGDNGEHIAPGHTLIAHPEADVGWQMVAGVMKRPES
jgi:hypothetical protein